MAEKLLPCQFFRSYLIYDTGAYGQHRFICMLLLHILFIEHSHVYFQIKNFPETQQNAKIIFEI